MMDEDECSLSKVVHEFKFIYTSYIYMQHGTN